MSDHFDLIYGEIFGTKLDAQKETNSSSKNLHNIGKSQKYDGDKEKSAKILKSERKSEGAVFG